MPASSWPWLLAGRRNCGRLGASFSPPARGWALWPRRRRAGSLRPTAPSRAPAQKSGKGKSKSTQRDDDEDDVSFRLDRLEGSLLQLTEVLGRLPQDGNGAHT